MEDHSIIEEYEDALSLCDFAINDEETAQVYPNSPPSQLEEDFFEFSSSNSSASSESDNNIIFCGKVISCKTEDCDNNTPLVLPSSSSSRLLNKSKITPNNSSSKPVLPQVRRSCSSKKHKAIIGLTRIPSKMDLNDLRERQSRKQITPPPMFPAAVDAEATAISGTGSSRKSRNWGLLRPFRAQDIASMLTRFSSLGCLRLARPCID